MKKKTNRSKDRKLVSANQVWELDYLRKLTGWGRALLRGVMISLAWRKKKKGLEHNRQEIMDEIARQNEQNKG